MSDRNIMRIPLRLLTRIQKLVRGFQGPLRKIPGPWFARFTNLPLKWATVTGRRVYFIDALHHKHGDVVRIAPNEVDFCDPATFREIHRHGNGFQKAEWYKNFSGYVDIEENHALFTMMDPKCHAARRRILARAFSKTEIRKHWEDEIWLKIEFAVERMNVDARSDPNGEVDCQKWWVLMAADVSSRITFGESFGLLQAGEVSRMKTQSEKLTNTANQKNDYLKAVERIAKANGINVELPFLKYLPIPSVRKLFDTPQAVTEWATKTVANSRKHGTAGVGNIFTPILAEAEKSQSHLSDVVLGREARSLIIAGSDTTANTLTFLVWCVLSRPDLHKSLVTELNQQQENGTFSDEVLETLPVLNAVIQETLRLYSAAPGSLPRKPPPGGATIGGYYIPGSAVVSTQAWSLHRNPRVWENPEE